MSKTKLLFNLYKDYTIKNSEEFKGKELSKYRLSIKELTEIFTSIINYQIDRYGCQLGKF